MALRVCEFFRSYLHWRHAGSGLMFMEPWFVGGFLIGWVPCMGFMTAHSKFNSCFVSIMRYAHIAGEIVCKVYLFSIQVPPPPRPKQKKTKKKSRHLHPHPKAEYATPYGAFTSPQLRPEGTPKLSRSLNYLNPKTGTV